jgi:hypothetical protein
MFDDSPDSSGAPGRRLPGRAANLRTSLPGGARSRRDVLAGRAGLLRAYLRHLVNQQSSSGSSSSEHNVRFLLLPAGAREAVGRAAAAFKADGAGRLEA